MQAPFPSGHGADSDALLRKIGGKLHPKDVLE